MGWYNGQTGMQLPVSGQHSQSPFRSSLSSSRSLLISRTYLPARPYAGLMYVVRHCPGENTTAHLLCSAGPSPWLSSSASPKGRCRSCSTGLSQCAALQPPPQPVPWGHYTGLSMLDGNSSHKARIVMIPSDHLGGTRYAETVEHSSSNANCLCETTSSSMPCQAAPHQPGSLVSEPHCLLQQYTSTPSSSSAGPSIGPASAPCTTPHQSS